MPICHGEPCARLGAVSAGRSVRVTGRLIRLDTAAARVLIEHRGEELSIDVSALAGSALQQGQLLQFIGEAYHGTQGESGVYVRARVVRNVANLDLEMYEKAVAATRQFIDELTS